MIDTNLFNSIKKPLSDAQTVYLFLPPNPSMDRVAAALGFYLSLTQTGKKVMVYCSTPMRVEYSDLVGINKVQKEMMGRNLTVSFDYVEDSIEKVSYNIEDNKFNLVIQPKAGFQPLSAEKVNFTYTGGEADLVWLIGVQGLDHLKEYQEKSENLFAPDKMVAFSIGNQPAISTNFGLIFPQAFSFSEVVVHLLTRLSLPLEADAATNLMMGVEKATKNFSLPGTGVASFEAAALCLRAGARRFFAQKKEPPNEAQAPLQPMSAQVSAQQAPASSSADTAEKDEKPKPDWLEPKIYRGDTRV